MDRRELMRSGGLVFLALAVSGWAETFGEELPRGSTRPARKSTLQSALERAKLRGWPLLILRAPTHPGQRDQLGKMWGTYFSLADDDSLEDLALCDIVCATDAEVLHRLPAVVDADDWRNSIALFVEPEDAKPRVVPGPIVRVPPWDPKRGFEDTKFAFLREIDHRLHRLIAPNRATIERRAEQSRKTLTASEALALGELNPLSSESCTPYAERTPAQVRLATDAHRAGDREAAPALVEQARKRLQDPPAGSKWETPWWEPSEIKVWVYGPCGIGTVNARSVRFLQFYTA